MLDLIRQLLASPEFQGALVGVIITVAGAAGALIARAVRNAWIAFRTRLLRKLDAEQLAIVDSLAAKAVRYAFQVLESEAAQAKLAEASRILAEQAAARGIPLTDAQIRLALEAALVDFKLELAKASLPTAPIGDFYAP